MTSGMKVKTALIIIIVVLVLLFGALLLTDPEQAGFYAHTFVSIVTFGKV